MRLEAVTAELRPRSDGETVDLGMVLVRRDFPRVFLIWWVAMLPILAVSVALFFRNPWWVMVWMWWMTPLGSRLVLFHLSRRLFGEEPVWKQVWREWPRALTRRFGYRYLWARFSPWRLMTMPVEDLEGLRGETYKMRCRVLLGRGDGLMISLLVARFLLTWLLSIGIVLTLSMFLPDFAERVGPEPEGVEEVNVLFQEGAWDSWVGVGAMLLAHSLVEIFSVGAGFSAYINQRTWIEGWDVELALKRLGARLRKMGSIAAIVLAGWFGWGAAAPVRAEPSPSQVVADVKSHPDFTVHKVKVREPKPPSSSHPPSGSGTSLLGQGLGAIFQVLGTVLFYLLLVAALAGLVYLIWRHRDLFLRKGGGTEKREAKQAQMVMGMEVTEESLPERLTDAVMELWRVGRRHEALALLYRGTLAQLIARRGVPIQESDTEHDCLRRVREASLEVGEYFQRLTGVWLMTAYARVEAEDHEVENLCREWPFEERRAG